MVIISPQCVNTFQDGTGTETKKSQIICDFFCFWHLFLVLGVSGVS
ncbi:hypothetical protein VCRA2112O188_110001 [Vibrio crassostreae]|nr:hypothetical protein VCRA2112O188_110001 [Vibrio crassostreae]CAK2122888.1 hypothetical protein VCRA2113O218_420001 [Vibrio crassostreae]CAK2913526.1 hypothetical protein VCRA2120O249_370001 [Vibrio crassostreae]CAK2925597.1 hypothetical protein VCRA2118O237_390001 [Vibrio crassostreae]CAK2927193.1 hypothetical protein VCRA2120O256_390001 [Vibrio crassostreae]